MDRSRVVMLAAIMAFVAFGAAAHAGPCATQISQVERQIQTLAAASPPGGAGDPSAPQSVGAQLHHQPTPGSVESAEHEANADGEAALARARKADDEGNASVCGERPVLHLAQQQPAGILHDETGVVVPQIVQAAGSGGRSCKVIYRGSVGRVVGVARAAIM